MPDQTGGQGRRTSPHVQEYLDKRGVAADQLGDETHAALNSLSPDELKAVEKVGDALEADGTPRGMGVSAIH